MTTSTVENSFFTTILRLAVGPSRSLQSYGP